ncbi:MAG: S8 family peptidase [Clostridium sp.]|nr:S8 family peptidase [Clostridium sp.]
MKNRYRLLLGACLLSVGTLYAGVRTDSLVAKKSNPLLLQQLELMENMSAGGLRAVPADVRLLPVSVVCTDAQALADRLTKAGVEATPVTSGLVVAQLASRQVEWVAAMDEVAELIGAHTAELYLDEAVRTTRAALMHEDTTGKLETPFTGKGVIVAVVDRGFEYAHPAFSTGDGCLRIAEAWNHALGKDHVTDEAEIKAAGNDGSDMMHATHVASIAAGTHVDGTPFVGMAPDADIVMVSSSLNLNTVLSEVKYLKEYAAREGKPCVVNMSFGSQAQTHDGLNIIYKGMDELLGEGMIAVQAIGNNGNLTQHASKTVAGEGDSLAVLVKLPAKDFSLCAYSSSPTAEKLAVSCYIYNKVDKCIHVPTADQLKLLRLASQIESGSGKAYAELSCSTPASLKLTEDEFLLVSWLNLVPDMEYHTNITGMERGELVSDAAVLPEGVTIGDARYGANPFGRRVLLVGSYNNKNKYTMLSGKDRTASILKPGDISYFSNTGPTAGDWLPMPLVCAPGGLVIAAYSKQQKAFNEETLLDLSMKITRDEEPFYYGMQMGTSMACPAVAGIVACWMQAYPQLTPEQATDIIARTAQNDEFTGDARNEWHPRWGYGKIDAYEGLKECLRLSGWTGLNDTHQTEQPVTFLKERDCWKVLMNSNEPYMEIQVVSADGQLVKAERHTELSCGDEVKVGLADLAPGLYLLSVKTAKMAQTRKMIR